MFKKYRSRIGWRGKLISLLILATCGWSCGSTVIRHPLESHSFFTYSGVWSEQEDSSESTRIGFAESASAFMKLVKQMAGRGYQVKDLEILVSDGYRQYAALWEAADEARPCLVNLTREDFAKARKRLRNTGFEVVDLEIYRESSGLRLAAVWDRVPGESIQVELDLDWATVKRGAAGLCPNGFHAIDVEPYAEGGPRLAAVCQNGSEKRRLLFSDEAGWRAGFLKQAKEFAQQGWRLVDFESTIADGKEVYLGLWQEGGGTQYLVVGGLWLTLEGHQASLARGVDPRSVGDLRIQMPPRRLIDLEIRGHHTFGDDIHHVALHDEPITVPPPG